MEIDILNIKCIKQQHLIFEAQFMKKLSDTEAELKKDVAYKKKRAVLI